MTALYERKTIARENLSQDLVYADKEVLATREDITRRRETLYTAMILGNNYGREVLLTCATEDGDEKVQGRVWAMTNKNIMLKSGYDIPLHCIRAVNIL